MQLQAILQPQVSTLQVVQGWTAFARKSLGNTQASPETAIVQAISPKLAPVLYTHNCQLAARLFTDPSDMQALGLGHSILESLVMDSKGFEPLIEGLAAALRSEVSQLFPPTPSPAAPSVASVSHSLLEELSDPQRPLYHQFDLPWRGGYGKVRPQPVEHAYRSSLDAAMFRRNLNDSNQFSIICSIEEGIATMIAAYEPNKGLICLHLTVSHLHTQQPNTDTRGASFTHVIAWPSSGGHITEEALIRIFKEIYGDDIATMVDLLYQQAATLEEEEGRTLAEDISNRVTKAFLTEVFQQ